MIAVMGGCCGFVLGCVQALPVGGRVKFAAIAGWTARVIRDAASAILQTNIHAGSARQRMKRVLLVDDEPADVAAIQQAYERVSVNVQLERAGSARHAWELLCCWAEAPGGRRPVCVLINLKPGTFDAVWLLEQMQTDPRFRTLPAMVIGSETGLIEQARLFPNVIGALERPGDELEWRRLIGSVVRLSQALPDLAEIRTASAVAAVECLDGQ